MATKVADGYLCTVCEKKYPNPLRADACRDSHELLLVPMTKEEVNGLIHAVFLGDTSLIPESLFETLRKVQRANVTKK